MMQTTFWGFSKKDVYHYIEELMKNYDQLFSKLEKEKFELIEKNEKLIEQVEKFKKITFYNIKDIDYYKDFIDTYFYKDWVEDYSKKAKDITSHYEQVYEELYNSIEGLKWQIYNMKSKLNKFINSLKLSSLYLEANEEDNILTKRLKNDFIIDGKVILPKGIPITNTMIENLKQKGLMIELLKHIAKEEQE